MAPMLRHVLAASRGALDSRMARPSFPTGTIQHMGCFVPNATMPFNLGGAFVRNVGGGRTGPGGRGQGCGTPPATQSRMDYRAMRYGLAVDRRFNVGVEGARQDGFGADRQTGPQVRRVDVGAVAGRLRPGAGRGVGPAPVVLVVDGGA